MNELVLTFGVHSGPGIIELIPIFGMLTGIIIPLSVFLISINQSLVNFLNRNKKYNSIAHQNILKSSSNSFSALVLGFKKISSGLIIGHIFSIILTSTYNFKHCIKDLNYQFINIKSMAKNFKKYIDFLKFSTLFS